jgi:hypothetical protein
VRKNLPRLAEELRDFGYEAHGFVTNLNCLPLWNIGMEFDTHTDVDSENWQHADDAKLVDRFLEVLPALSGQPWFAYVHAMGPHAPYDPPGGFETRFQPEEYAGTATDIARQKAIDLYDAEIAYTDAQFGRVVATLKRLDMYDNTAIIVLADHGEEFWEHGGTDHGKTLYEEQLRVPLVWKLPGGSHKGARRDALVEMVDIAPTILEMVGAPLEPRFQGRSIWDYIDGREREPVIGFCSLELNEANLRASKTTAKKYIRNFNTGNRSWYDLETDPGEQEPIPEMPPWGEPLVQHAAHMAQRGRNGLHILLTREPGSERELRCYIETEEFGAYDMVFPHQRGGGLHAENGVVFLIHLRDIKDPAIARAWREAGQRDNAHLFVEVSDDVPVTLTLETGDGFVGPENVHMGKSMTPMRLDHVVLNPAAIEATWADMETAEDSREFGVYVWYEAGPGTRERDELAPEVRDALRGHGYLAD